MKYVDVKVTVWHRLIVADETSSEELIAFIKDFGMDYVLDQVNAIKETKILWGTHESVPPEKNNGVSTVLLYDNGRRVWENGQPYPMKEADD